MSKRFITSGFLFHVKTQQLLLHKPTAPTDSTARWTMFSDVNKDKEEGKAVFERIILEQVGIKIPKKSIVPVYDYFFQAMHKVHYIFYAEVKKIIEIPPKQSEVLSWFTFKQITKMKFSEQTKQDITIAERVINAQARSIAPKVIMPRYTVTPQ